MKTYRQLSIRELNALHIFAADYGKDWKEKLAFTYWVNARIYRDKTDKAHPELHVLRNDLGPSWLSSYKLEVGA